MRILYVTNGFPYPPTSGYLRHYFLIKELAQCHRITLVSIVSASFVPEHAEALAPFAERVLTFASTVKSGLLGKALGRVRSLAGRDRAARQMCRAVERLMREEPFDLVLFSGKRTLPVIECLESLPVITDMCDATSMNIRGRMRHASFIWLPLLVLDYAKVRLAERRMIGKAAHLLFASSRDREQLLGRSGNHATVVSNGIDLAYWRRSSTERGINTIIFTGVMNYAPNYDAALYLIKKILPLVQRSVPGAELLIVGRDPLPKLLRAGRRPGVTVTGFVDDVRPYLDRATVFAAPLRFGAGIQNKILEAMAMEVPVVASPIAADGLRTEQGELPPVQVARRPSEFAEIIIRQLIDGCSQRAPVAAGRQFLERHFDWKLNAGKLEEVINTVAKVARG
jgi:glycosyltransferase involved in cell wall biosynthesis